MKIIQWLLFLGRRAPYDQFRLKGNECLIKLQKISRGYWNGLIVDAVEALFPNRIFDSLLLCCIQS